MVRNVTEYPHKVEVLEAGLWIPLSSGHRLAARLWRPADRRPVPVLLEFLPYRKGDFRREREQFIHHYFAGHGYASIRVDMRGSGDSSGVMRDEYEQQEQDDAVETIAWLAKQEWCTGRVGMFGISWSGFNALQVAARRPPALRAIFSSCSTDDRYTDDMHYMGGCLLNDNLDWGTLLLALLLMPGDPRIMGEEWRSNWQDRLAAVDPTAAAWMKHQTRDSYWKHGSVNEDYSSIVCPVFVHGGWLDGYTNAVFRMLEHLKVPRLGLVGPHAHQLGFEDRAPGPSYGILQEVLRWWDYWLKDLPTGIMDEPQLRAFMGDNIPAAPWYADCPGRWIGEQHWPSPDIKLETLYINSNELGDTSCTGAALQNMSPQTVGLDGGEWCPYGTGGTGPEFPGDQRRDDALSLIFDSTPLTERLEILGAPIVTLELAVDQPSAFVAVRVNDVKPDGSATRVSFGILNIAHRSGSENLEPVEPGKRYRVRVKCNDAAYSFAPGHRIRVSVSTTYWPMVWPSPRPVTLSIFPGAGKLELPVRPLRAHEPAMKPLEGPEAGPLTKKREIVPAPRVNKITHDLINGLVEQFVERGAGIYRIEENEIETGVNITERTSIDVNNPLAATTEITVHLRTGRVGSLCDVWARYKLTADAENFFLESTAEAQEKGSSVFSRKWNYTIPRGVL